MAARPMDSAMTCHDDWSNASPSSATRRAARGGSEPCANSRIDRRSSSISAGDACTGPSLPLNPVPDEFLTRLRRFLLNRYIT